MKSPLAAACVVLCTAAVSAQVASAQVASAQAGARTTVPGALTGSPEPVTRNPEPTHPPPLATVPLSHAMQAGRPLALWYNYFVGFAAQSSFRPVQ